MYRQTHFMVCSDAYYIRFVGRRLYLKVNVVSLGAHDEIFKNKWMPSSK
jgi:hypothetical protein